MTGGDLSPIIVLALCWAGNVNLKMAFPVQVCKSIQANCWVIPKEFCRVPEGFRGRRRYPTSANKTGLTR